MKRFWGVSIENIPIPYLKLEKMEFPIRYCVFLMGMLRGVVASAEFKIYKFLYFVVYCLLYIQMLIYLHLLYQSVGETEGETWTVKNRLCLVDDAVV